MFVRIIYIILVTSCLPALERAFDSIVTFIASIYEGNSSIWMPLTSKPVPGFDLWTIVANTHAWRRRIEKCDEDHRIVGAVQKRQIHIWIHIYEEVIYVHRHPGYGVESTDEDQESSYLMPKFLVKFARAHR